MAATEKNKQTKVKWTGLGLWNVFFIGEFLLGGFGYLSLNLLQNVLLLVLSSSRSATAICAGFVL